MCIAVVLFFALSQSVFSGQDDAHGGFVRPHGGDAELQHAPRGRPFRPHRTGALQRQVALHRRRQQRTPQVRLVLQHQEGLGLVTAGDPPPLVGPME